MMMKPIGNSILTLCLLLLWMVDVFAQGGPAPPPALNEVPLDGLSTMLLAAGAAYGGRKILRKKKE
jgi:hypothetical protein